jgi:uncharacterized protein (TIGR02391 family)
MRVVARCSSFTGRRLARCADGERPRPGRAAEHRAALPGRGSVRWPRDDQAVLPLSADELAALPVDERALLVLRELVDTNEWSEHNYVNEYGNSPAAWTIAETLGWLRGNAFTAHKPGQHSPFAIFVTARGHEALEQGISTVRAVRRVEHDLHPLLAQRVRRQFLLAEYEQAVLVAMKAVEVRVRELGGFPDDKVGVVLMQQAFSAENGPLTDPDAVQGERVGVMYLFAGAYAVFRNPAGHRDVDYDDVTEAAEAVDLASLLMRILDRVQQRLSG